MNFLAHSFLSFSEGQLVGNMIADFVKNRDVKSLPDEVQEGIRLHRKIDYYTDNHTIIHESKVVFRPAVRLYAGAFVDVSFDYFLANDFGIKSDEEWRLHAQKVYEILDKYNEFLPENFKIVLGYMKKDNWLYNYRHDWGIEYSFRNVVRKAQYLSDEINVFPLFLEHKNFLKSQYEKFFPELLKEIESKK